jgi:hypothetical protein
VVYPGIFRGGGGGYARIFLGGVQKVQLRTEGRDNRDLVAVAP